MNAARRTQLLLLAAGLLATPIYASAQTAARQYRVGVLAREPKTLLESLKELGYVDGRNVVFEVRNAEGRSELFDPFALDLVRLRVDVIVASNPNAVLSAKRATKTIPIVMMHTPDPVQLGFVASLARPGGNITGVTTLSADLSIKQLEILKEAVPRMSRVALLRNPHNPWHSATVKALQNRSRSLGIQLQVLEVRGPDAFGGAFHAMTTERAQAVLVLVDPMTFSYPRRLTELAVQRRLPMMGGLPDYAEAGSLMSFWANTTEVSRRAASYVDRILRGARAGDLPIEQPTKFEFVANLKTARDLGITPAVRPSARRPRDRMTRLRSTGAGGAPASSDEAWQTASSTVYSSVIAAAPGRTFDRTRRPASLVRGDRRWRQAGQLQR